MAGPFDDIPNVKPASATTAPEAPQASMLWDVMRSLGTGLRAGAEGLAGLPGDLGQLGNLAVEKTRTGLLGLEPNPAWNDPPDMSDVPFGYGGVLPRALTSQDIREKITDPLIGEGYKPQSTPGKFAREFGAFAPAAAIGGGGLPALGTRMITQAAVPSVASETAGQLTEGSDYEGLARGLAAITGGTVAGATLAPRLPPTAQQTQRGAIVDAAGRQDVHLPAAAMPDAPMAGYLAGKMGQIPFLGQPLAASRDRTVQGLDDALERLAGNQGSLNYGSATENVRDLLGDWQRNVSPQRMETAYDAVDAAIAQAPSNTRYRTTPMSNTRQTRETMLREMAGDTTTVDQAATDALEAAVNRPGGLTYQEMKRLRTKGVGSRVSGDVLPDSGSSRSAFKRFYGPVTEDMRLAVYRQGGPRALREWEAANDLTSEIKARQENIARIIGAEGDASRVNIANRLLNLASTKSSGSLEILRDARRAVAEAGAARGVGGQAWDDLGSAMVYELGRDPSSVQRVFSPDRFLTAMSRFDREAGRVLFGRGMWDQLQDIRLLSETHRNLMRQGNPSGTGGVVTLLSLLGGMAAAPTTTLATVGGGLATSAILARPATRAKFVNWARARNGALRSGTASAFNSYVAATKDFAPYVAMESGRDEKAVLQELIGQPKTDSATDPFGDL